MLEGSIVDTDPVHAPHAYTVDETHHRLSALLPAGWTARGEKPINLAASCPQPDVAVARGARRDYRQRHPGPTDLGLLVEVVDSTRAMDRTTKAALYAAAAIPEYWM